MNAMRIPIGFRFNPSDEEVIVGYLWARVVGEELPWNGVAEKQIYGALPPWEVFNDGGDFFSTKIEGGATKKSTYVFTTLTRASKKKISRRAGNGTWKGQSTPTKISSSDTREIIGHMRMLSFVPDATPPLDSGHWTMHEYYLSKEMAKKSGNPNAADLVICKITKIIKINNNNNNNMLPMLPLPMPPLPEEEESSSSDSSPPSKKQKMTLICGKGSSFADQSLPNCDFIDVDEFLRKGFPIFPVEDSAAMPNWDPDVIDIDNIFGPDYQLPIHSY